MNYLATAIILCWTAAAIGCGQTSDTGARAPDNTAVNERDRSAYEPTADQQKETTADRDLTARIRQSVMADDSMSTYAKNIKIISQDGSVTLKGPVASDSERQSIVAMAVAAAGDASRVTDEISVTP
jgi:hyperosmotically inducible periplasmic protein